MENHLLDQIRRNSYIPKIEPFEIEVTVRDMHPGLTSEGALIGTRRVSSAVNAVKVLCTDSDSGEQTKVPDGEEDQWQNSFSAAIEDVRISYSETVAGLAMLNRYGLHEGMLHAVDSAISPFNQHTRVQNSILLPSRTQEKCQLTGTILSRGGWDGRIYQMSRKCDILRMPSTSRMR